MWITARYQQTIMGSFFGNKTSAKPLKGEELNQNSALISALQTWSICHRGVIPQIYNFSPLPQTTNYKHHLSSWTRLTFWFIWEPCEDMSNCWTKNPQIYSSLLSKSNPSVFSTEEVNHCWNQWLQTPSINDSRNQGRLKKSRTKNKINQSASNEKKKDNLSSSQQC